MKIPVKNIYYLLAYAWNKLEESQLIPLGRDDFDDMQNLLARVLTGGVNHLFKKGLERDYISVEESYPGIKGKILFDESLRRNTFHLGRAVCRYDEFSHNILHNQILKSTLRRLAKSTEIDGKLKPVLWKSYQLFHDVDEIALDKSTFKGVRIHRNNAFYDFLIRICQLVVEQTVLDEQSGRYVFRDFLRDDKKMAALFEEFVRNFYARMVSPPYRVRREDIDWYATPGPGSDAAFLPKMQTDITLESSSRKIVIDTKFYGETLITWHDAEKIRSGHLYQIYAYVRNLEHSPAHPLNPVCEGMLLYPTVEQELDQSYQMGGHPLRIATVDLSREWREIERRLMGLV